MAGGANIRVGSAERDSALRSLGTHLTADRLDVTEYEDRCTAVASARTRAELLAVFEDLPAPHPTLDTDQEYPLQVQAPAQEKSPLLDYSPTRMSKPVVLTVAGLTVVAAIVVVAITATWWALIPALLIIAVIFLTN